MMTFQVNPSLPTAKAFISGGSFSCGPADAPAFSAYRSYGMGAGGERAAFGHSQMRKFPLMHSLNNSRNDKTFLSSFIVKGAPELMEEKLELEGIHRRSDPFGKLFLFDKTCSTLEGNRTTFPPLPRDFHSHRSANLHPFRISEELSHSHAGRPFTLSYPRRDKTTSPNIFLPSALVINGRNTFPLEKCKLTRPKVHYPAYHPTTVKDNQKCASYPDPMVGAPRAYVQRISELSSLQGETTRQETLKKMKKSRRPSS
uniref:Uncharacterized protein n=1 Tax=Iconisemion striatum TaxID=60296 RepID=A0A1A7YX07_9TELE